MFFNDVDIEEEALYFLRDGHFTTSLGDAMPLATANVLQMSLFIIVPQQNIPFLSVFPRYNVEGMSSLWLAYNNEGPGHYDVLIEKKSEEDKAKNNVPNTPQHSDIFDKSNAARVKKSAEKATDVSFCRCGINAKVRQEFSKTHPQRKYKSRCKCIAKFAACSTACKCHGNCGAVDCKKSVHTAKGNRKSQKRGKHQIDTSTNEYCKISLAKNEELNFLEYFVVVAIVNYFISICLSDNIDQMCKEYNDIVNMILEEESLMYLPVRIHSKKQIVNTIKKSSRKSRL